MQGYFIAVGLESLGASQGIAAVVEPGMMFRISATISLVGGTLFLMWIGEQITSRGIGNGVSLIIMAGIVASLPRTLAQLFEGGRTGTLDSLLRCDDHRRRRRAGPVHLLHGARPAPRAGPISQAPDRARGDAAGTQPPADQAQHRRRHPADLRLVAAADAADGAADGGGGQRRTTAVSEWLITLSTYLQHGSPLYLAALRRGIVFFCFFYTAVQFNSEETAEQLKRHGGFIPGIRPGKATETYFDYLLNRITVIGAAYLVMICLIPEVRSARPACPSTWAGPAC